MEKIITKYFHLSPPEVLQGYSTGIFPMGNDDGNSISWYEANPRTILPIEQTQDKLHIPRSLSQVIKKNIFEIRIDTQFEKVIQSCANRYSTWINELIIDAYTELFNKGFAHSVEAWLNNELAGGLYGVAYKGAFFGESMFYKKSNASKVAIVRLYEILKKNGYMLFDIQMMTPHFKILGAVNVSKKAYLEMLDRAMEVEKEFRF